MNIRILRSYVRGGLSLISRGRIEFFVARNFSERIHCDGSQRTLQQNKYMYWFLRMQYGVWSTWSFSSKNNSFVGRTQRMRLILILVQDIKSRCCESRPERVCYTETGIWWQRISHLCRRRYSDTPYTEREREEKHRLSGICHLSTPSSDPVL